jgi:hypothetical protein
MTMMNHAYYPARSKRWASSEVDFVSCYNPSFRLPERCIVSPSAYAPGRARVQTFRGKRELLRHKRAIGGVTGRSSAQQYYP